MSAPRRADAGRADADDDGGAAYPASMASIVFKENPGGEYRKSYHGYPSGYAQLIASPTTWLFNPMQIDTHNRACVQPRLLLILLLIMLTQYY